MFRLRKKNPPFGTDESPIMEYTYSEQVRVVDGNCRVQFESTRDFLLKTGYEEIREDELVPVGDTSGHSETEDDAPSGRSISRNRSSNKHRR